MAGKRNKGARGASNFLLQIDGAFDGFSYVKSVKGGGLKKEVAENNMGAQIHSVKGVAGKVKVNPITFECSMAVGRGLLEWINDCFNKMAIYRDGAIFVADDQFRVVREIRFERALIKKVTLPAMDGDGKDHAYLTVEIQPENIWDKHYGTGGAILNVNEGNMKAREFTAGFFKFGIDDMPETEKGQITKFDSISWECKLKEDSTSIDRMQGWIPCGFTLPDFKVTFNPLLNDYFTKWSEDFIRMGNSREVEHKSGSLEFYDQRGEGGSPLGTVEFFRIGITESLSANYDAGATNLDRSTVTLYASGLEMSSTLAEAD